MYPGLAATSQTGLAQAGLARHTFRCASEANDLWKRLGCDLHFVQLTPGPLNGHIDIEQSGGITIVSLACNQALLGQGQRNPNCLHFCLENTDHISMHRVWGEPIQPNSLHGFCSKISESFFQTTPNFHISIAMIPIERFQNLAHLDGAASFMDEIEATNTMMLNTDSFEQIRELIRPRRDTTMNRRDPLNSELLEAQLLDSLSQGPRQTSAPVNLFHRHALIRELVNFGFEHSTSALTLQQVCKNLFSSPTTITVGCRELFGLGPMALLKRIRLQQVQRVLQDQDLQRSLNCFNVHEVSAHYGFASRNHFARDYRTAFGESPLATMKSSR